MISVVILAVPLALMISAGDSSTATPGPTTDAIAALIESELGLISPVTVRRIGTYRDGGSIGGLLEDAIGKELEFAWDGQMRIVDAEADRDSLSRVEQPPRLAYLGNDYPFAPEARPLEVNSPAETALLFALRAFVDRTLPSSVQKTVLSEELPWGQRVGHAGSVSPYGEQAAEALRLVDRLEKQRLAAAD